MSELPDRRPTIQAGQLPVPAHHRPPNIVYTEDGQPVHFTIGQPPAPQNITLNLPEQRGLPPELQRLIIVTFLILAVIVVCVAGICAIVVICGGTLMGIIGTIGANASTIGVVLIGIIVAAGWALAKIKPLAKEK